MFNKMIRKNNRKLRQRICELVESCKNIEKLVNFKNEYIDELKRKISENEYREQLWEKERKELNNVISNLIEERNKKTVNKLKDIKKLEATNVISKTASNI